jgi:glycosyltransferase involved in cell wall biosynthesis
MRMPKVSVVVPTYNRAEMLARCLGSILSQSFLDFEVVVVDDGSTDNTRDVVAGFPVIYTYQANQGPGAARNRGIEMAKGEYVAFLDSDDILCEESLRKRVEILDSDPQAGFCYTQAYLVDETGRIFGLEKPHLYHTCTRPSVDELSDYLRYGNHVTLSTIMARRECLLEVGAFDPNVRLSEDLDMWLRLAQAYRVAHIAEPLVMFRQHDDSISTQRELREWEQTNASIIEKLCNDTQFGAQLRHYRTMAYYRLYSAMGARACNRGDMQLARRYLLQAVKSHPRAMFGSTAIPWLLWFPRTWVPIRLVLLMRRVKRHLTGASLTQSRAMY